jgi:hypothetical protein
LRERQQCAFFLHIPNVLGMFDLSGRFFFLLFSDVKHTVFNVIWQANYTQSIRQLDCRFYRQYNISSTTSTKVNTCWKWKRNYKYIPIYVYTPSGSHWWHILTHYNLIAGLEIITHEHNNIMYLNKTINVLIESFYFLII